MQVVTDDKIGMKEYIAKDGTCFTFWSDSPGEVTICREHGDSTQPYPDDCVRVSLDTLREFFAQVLPPRVTVEEGRVVIERDASDKAHD